MRKPDIEQQLRDALDAPPGQRVPRLESAVAAMGQQLRHGRPVAIPNPIHMQYGGEVWGSPQLVGGGPLAPQPMIQRQVVAAPSLQPGQPIRAATGGEIRTGDETMNKQPKLSDEALVELEQRMRQLLEADPQRVAKALQGLDDETGDQAYREGVALRGRDGEPADGDLSGEAVLTAALVEYARDTEGLAEAYPALAKMLDVMLDDPDVSQALLDGVPESDPDHELVVAVVQPGNAMPEAHLMRRPEQAVPTGDNEPLTGNTGMTDDETAAVDDEARTVAERERRAYQEQEAARGKLNRVKNIGGGDAAVRASNARAGERWAAQEAERERMREDLRKRGAFGV
ncbi:MAG: hypothetical protein R3E46_04225 [Sedimenticolaceae bacterium]